MENDRRKSKLMSAGLDEMASLILARMIHKVKQSNPRVTDGKERSYLQTKTDVDLDF